MFSDASNTRIDDFCKRGDYLVKSKSISFLAILSVFFMPGHSNGMIFQSRFQVHVQHPGKLNVPAEPRSMGGYSSESQRRKGRGRAPWAQNYSEEPTFETVKSFFFLFTVLFVAVVAVISLSV